VSSVNECPVCRGGRREHDKRSPWFILGCGEDNRQHCFACAGTGTFDACLARFLSGAFDKLPSLQTDFRKAVAQYFEEQA
jgi:hypothetical protein